MSNDPVPMSAPALVDMESEMADGTTIPLRARRMRPARQSLNGAYADHAIWSAISDIANRSPGQCYDDAPEPVPPPWTLAKRWFTWAWMQMKETVNG